MTADPANETKWKQRYNALKQFKQINGHCNVISKDPANKQLSRWVENQRMFYKKEKLPPHRIALLEELGFEWIRPHRSQTNLSKKTTVAVPLITDEPDGDVTDGGSLHSREHDQQLIPSQVIEEEAVLVNNPPEVVEISMRSHMDPYNVIAFV